MSEFDFFAEMPVAVTVCDTEGIIVYMNDKSIATFQKDGGSDLIGRPMLDCHPGASKDKVKKLLAGEKPNTYTIEKNGLHKMIHQTPWYVAGVYQGFIEFSFEIPAVVHHFVRE